MYKNILLYIYIIIKLCISINKRAAMHLLRLFRRKIQSNCNCFLPCFLPPSTSVSASVGRHTDADGTRGSDVHDSIDTTHYPQSTITHTEQTQSAIPAVNTTRHRARARYGGRTPTSHIRMVGCVVAFCYYVHMNGHSLIIGARAHADNYNSGSRLLG